MLGGDSCHAWRRCCTCAKLSDSRYSVLGAVARVVAPWRTFDHTMISAPSVSSKFFFLTVSCIPGPLVPEWSNGRPDHTRAKALSELPPLAGRGFQSRAGRRLRKRGRACTTHRHDPGPGVLQYSPTGCADVPVSFCVLRTSLARLLGDA
ncbi:hypothetical protein FB451DRAFT_120120 [Mycena latifolia]|nr:hypothetical protein FB451DRAFT_120120 [Mycena latifolia]